MYFGFAMISGTVQHNFSPLALLETEQIAAVQELRQESSEGFALLLVGLRQRVTPASGAFLRVAAQ
jgi:hypothetical protein